MMGRRENGQGQFFYSFDLDEVVPPDHLVRQIDGLLDLSWVHKELAPYYSHTGRPSIDPVLMIRMLLVGYAFAIRSERRICAEIQVNLAYRWFCKLGIEDKIPDHSVFCRARQERFRESDALRRALSMTPNPQSARSSSTWRRTHAWRSPPAGTGSASYRSRFLPTNMRLLFPRLRRQNASFGLRRHFSSWRNTISSTKGGPPRSGRCTGRPWLPTTGNSRSGPRTAQKISRPAPRWSAPKSLVSRAARSMPWTSTNRPSARHRQTA